MQSQGTTIKLALYCERLVTGRPETSWPRQRAAAACTCSGLGLGFGLANPNPNPNPNPNQAGVADEAELLDLALEIAAQACPAECGGEEVRGPLAALLGELGQLARLQRAAVTLSLDLTLT